MVCARLSGESLKLQVVTGFGSASQYRLRLGVRARWRNPFVPWSGWNTFIPKGARGAGFMAGRFRAYRSPAASG